jgi:hypothetical protein
MDTVDVGVVPRPTTCGIGKASFDLAELKQFVFHTEESSFVVRDESGNFVGSASVRLIREFLASQESVV